MIDGHGDGRRRRDSAGEEVSFARSSGNGKETRHACSLARSAIHLITNYSTWGSKEGSAFIDSSVAPLVGGWMGCICAQEQYFVFSFNSKLDHCSVVLWE